MKPANPSILVALMLSYQNGRDCYTGILQYLARKHRNWDVHLIREGLTLAALRNEARWGLDGVICDYNMHDDAIAGIRRLGIPCVAIDTAHPRLFRGVKRVAFIDIDSGDIGSRGAKLFAGRYNYATYGVIGYEQSCNWSERRVESFVQTVAEQGKDCETLRIRRSDLRTPETRRAMCEWAKRLHRPAAVMAVCDELARTFISAVASCGARIPQDIAVLGVDDESILCTHMSPTLSSVKPDFEKSGFMAAESMDVLLHGRKSSEGKTIRRVSPVKSIIERESTGPSSTTGLMVLRAENFIRDHLDRCIHANDVARHLKVSRRLLDMRFREITGRTVLSAIHAAQLENVRRLLRSSALSISEIAALCRFRSPSQLTRLFKASFGMTMSDYVRGLPFRR